MTNEELIEKCEAVAKEIEDCLNWNDKILLTVLREKVPRMHKTLQQNFWRTINSLALSYSIVPYDLRNEASVKYCQKIAMLEDVGFPNI